MADTPNQGGTPSAEGADAKDFELQVAGEHEDAGSDKEELYDASGKPLPWNQSKRFRKLYGEAKEGRKLNEQLKELGLTAKDLPRLQQDLQRLEQFDTAYNQYLQEKKAGNTSPTEDKEAQEAQAQRNKMRKVLKELGVRLEDDPEVEQAAQARQNEAHKTRVVSAANNRIQELAEDAGYALDIMNKEDRTDLLEEFDFRISKIIERNPDLRQAFIEGSLRPIEKAFKQALEKVSVKPSLRKATGIGNLPPRVSNSSPGSRSQSKVTQEPKNIKEAGEQMAAELKAINAKRRAEGS